jgi:hypothetical protein
MSTTTTTARITVDEFENSDLYDDNRVELIDGEVIRKDEMKPAPVLAVELVKQGVGPMLPARRFIRQDGPVRIPNFKTLDVVIDGTVVGSIAVDDILPGARHEQPRPEGNGA